MLRKNFILERDTSASPTTANLEQVVWNFILAWHYEDNLQEVINMALAANNIPANVIKVGGGPDQIKFLVVPYPGGMKSGSKKLESGFQTIYKPGR